MPIKFLAQERAEDNTIGVIILCLSQRFCVPLGLLDGECKSCSVFCQAFAAPERLVEMAEKVREALQKALPTVVAKMRLYLSNPATHAILFKPIKSNIAEAHGQIAALMDSEYTSEEAAKIALTPPQELAALLDSLC